MTEDDEIDKRIQRKVAQWWSHE